VHKPLSVDLLANQTISFKDARAAALFHRAVRADLKRRITFSRTRVGWCEFSARLFSPPVVQPLVLAVFALVLSQ